LLLHDIHPATVLALPMLLKELKENGYKIVQAVPAGDRPASVPEKAPTPTTASGGWPRTVETPPLPPARKKQLAHHHRALKKHVRLHHQKTASAKRHRVAKNFQSRL
jgi:hypothetical protein